MMDEAALSNICMQVSDVLARVLKQLQVVTKESENRQGVLAAIDVLSKANDESDWLSEYEDDPLKYKVLHAMAVYWRYR